MWRYDLKSKNENRIKLYLRYLEGINSQGKQQKTTNM